MIKLTSLLATLLLACSVAPGQQNLNLRPDTQDRYVAQKETSLSAAVEKLTIQQPTSGSRVVVFEGAWVYCSVACDFTLSQAGTAATTTALTPTPLNASPAAKALAFHTSNAGAGTTIAKYSVGAGGTLGIDLKTMWQAGNSGASNLSIATNSVTGTVRIAIQWIER